MTPRRGDAGSLDRHQVYDKVSPCGCNRRFLMRDKPLNLPFVISCRPPHLVATFDAPQTMLSWSLTKPGFQKARRVAWREVRNADLPAAEDPIDSIGRLMADADLADSVCLVTSRDVTRYHLAQTTVEGVTATALATAGLSNGERIGERCTEPVLLPGTVNVLLHVSCPLSEAALIETVSMATQARTVAIMEAQVERVGVTVTGTGTDCIVVSAPEGVDRARFAGMHTAIGEAVGGCVVRVIRESVAVWRADWAAATERRRPAAE